MLVAGINLFGLKLGAQMQNLFTLLKLLAVAALVVCGLFLAGAGSKPMLAADPARSGVGFMSASLPVLFAYSGFTYLNNLAGEVRDPQRTLPRALSLGMLGVILGLCAGQRGLSRRTRP